MAQWHPDLLNRYIAPGIADFNVCDIPDSRGAYQGAETWMSNHFLNTIFRAEYAGKQRQYAVNAIFRAQACFELYHEAREKTADFIAKSALHSPKVGLYYKAIRAWESCFINLQILVDVLCQLAGKRVFEPNDGTDTQRAYDIANTIKHWADAIRRDKHQENDTLPMWLSNVGFHTRTHALSYIELSDLIKDCANAAELLKDPKQNIQGNA